MNIIFVCLRTETSKWSGLLWEFMVERLLGFEAPECFMNNA